MNVVFGQFLSGLASASTLFLVASGLSIIFGVIRIVNFAHGSLYMLGAYVAWSLVNYLPSGPLGFWGGILLAAVIVAAVGGIVEMVLLRRIYQSPELFQLLATFGVLLIVQDVTLWTWGPEDHLGPRAPGLAKSVVIFGQRFPQYDLFLICIGPVILAALWLLFHRTRWGTLVRAATIDRGMVAALGVDQKILFTSVFIVGSFLAALSGGLVLPREPAALSMDLGIISDAFVVVVVGGMGSIAGAYLAALIVAELQAFLLLLPNTHFLGVDIIFSKMTLIPGFLVMAIVLVLRPYGLFGRPSDLNRSLLQEPVVRRAPQSLIWVGCIALVGLSILPLVASAQTVSVFTQVMIFILVASSLHFVMGPGGMHSFGHAAYFGVGAYAAAMAAKYYSAPIVVGVVASPLVAGLFAFVVGWFCVRLSGTYLAMLTLAFAQIVWSISFQWTDLTGGENGLLNVWPEAWVASNTRFFYFVTALCILGVILLRRILFAPFGYALRGCRDSADRAEAIGINVFGFQWLGFILAGMFAGLGGALFAYFKGSVFPTYLSMSKSLDMLLMVLLGGIQTISGPIVGALSYSLLIDELVRLTDHWRICLGLMIVFLVAVFPSGIAGFVNNRWILRKGAEE
jgi:branched-chain amino acid transport system permease protein